MLRARVLLPLLPAPGDRRVRLPPRGRGGVQRHLRARAAARQGNRACGRSRDQAHGAARGLSGSRGPQPGARGPSPQGADGAGDRVGIRRRRGRRHRYMDVAPAFLGLVRALRTRPRRACRNVSFGRRGVHRNQLDPHHCGRDRAAPRGGGARSRAGDRGGGARAAGIDGRGRRSAARARRRPTFASSAVQRRTGRRCSRPRRRSEALESWETGRTARFPSQAPAQRDQGAVSRSRRWSRELGGDGSS